MKRVQGGLRGYRRPDAAALRRALRTRRAAAAVLVLGFVVGFAATNLAWPDPRRPLEVGVAPIGSPVPSGSLTPSARPPREWTALELAPLEQIAELAAVDRDAGGVAVDTAFTLTSFAEESAADLAGRLRVSPGIAFATSVAADGRSAEVRPASPLLPGAVYRFSLLSPEGLLAGSWAFQTKQPLRVVTTLPADQATSVPLDSGIEVVFDQDGVTDPSSSFEIAPEVRGRFEQHGRTLVFVPSRLEPATIYSVTIRRGVGLSGSDQVLEGDVRFSFETQAEGAPSQSSLTFTRHLFETSTREAATLTTRLGLSEGEAPSELEVRVHRFGGLDPAIDGFRTIIRRPEWAMWSDIGLVPTEGLPRVLTVDVTPQPVGGSGNDHWFDLPEPMPAGWYLVEVGDGPRPAQAILQVTDVAVYAVATVTDSLVWVNDVSTGQAIESAGVTLNGADSLGTTDLRGLLRIQTPDLVEGTQPGGEAPGPIFVVRDGPNRSAFAPLAGASGEGFYDPLFGWRADSDSGSDDYWRLFYTDRWRYRADDDVEAWGFLRERGSGRVPERVQVQVASEGAELSQPPVRSTEVQPGADGSFAAKVPLDGLPQGSYRLELWAGRLLLAQTYISVGVIRKPAYQLELSTPRHAYIRGEDVDLTVAANFFEGTPVPGVDLGVEAFGAHTTRTGSDGRATIHATATSENDGGWCCAYLGAAATSAEEGDISGATEIAVFPSSTWLDAEASMADGRLTVGGSARSVDLADFDRRWTADRYDLEVRGPDLPGARVSASVTELIPERRLVGQAYDFIEKRVVDRYEYSMRERTLGTHAMTTGADGSFALGIPVVREHEHAIVLTTTDAAGRTMRLNVHAGPSADEITRTALRPYLESGDICSGGFREYSTGEAVSLTMRDRDGPLPSGGSARYLFAATQRGLRDVVVQSDPTLTGRFEPEDAPDVTYLGVYFTGDAYVQVRTFRAALDPRSRAVTVELSTNAPRYGPGETATVSIRTLDPTGRGVPATVTLRAIDEKLYAIGAAGANDPLRDLYQPVSSGLIDSYASHEPPLDTPECGGDTAGGGDDRSDFRDSLGLRQVQTGPDGRATSTFDLSDDLTSWRLSAAAVTPDLHVGQSTVLVPVGLPFFVEPTIAPEYLVDDRPNIRLRAYGSELAPGDPVAFTLESETLGLAATAIEGRAFEALDVPLPSLSLGEHSIAISGRAGTGSAMRQDRITRTFRVVASRLRSTATAYDALTPEYVPPGGEGLTTYSFADAGRGRFLPLLESLATTPGPRVDRALAADVARKLLIEEFRFEPSRLPARPFDGSIYQGDDGLVALLPFAGGDLTLTAQVAFAAPEGFEGSQLRAAFAAVRVDPQETRERKLVALLGLASLGDPVLGAVHDAAADDGLTVRERLYVALAAAALGDDGFALRIGRDLLNASGQRLGPWIRLRVGETLDDTIEATALLALVTAAAGDPLAPLLQAYVDENPPTETLASLEQVTAARLMLSRQPSASARLAYTIAGRRQVVDLAPGETFRLLLTAEQRASLELESLEGKIGVAASWDVPVRTEELAQDPTLSIERAISPEGDIGDDRTVAVTIRVRFAPQVLRGCYRVVDLAPSGLVPIAREGWPTVDVEGAGDVMSPWSIEGQRVEFCAAYDPKRPLQPMRYLAHVVSTGSYLWEPTVAQSAEASQSTAYTGARTVTVVASSP